MIGIIRLAIAISIIWIHLVSQDRQWGGNAVFVFYLLSGYFATASMQSRYQGRPWKFLASRALRILPIYWLILTATTVWIVFGNVSEYFATTINYPSALEILGLDLSPRSMPVAWVLPVFFFWWAAIAFGAASTQQRATAFLGLGLVLWLGFGVAPGRNNWGTLWAGGLPFSLGAVFYWLGIRVPRDTGLGSWAGALSFPVFLMHYSLAGALSSALDLAPGYRLFSYTVIATLALSWLLVVAVERPIADFRKTLRS